ncbi:MAG TPA: DinB family protein [Chryseosolibacter sp.]|nr:DinB family protein [Chryseosolibacter sp.]
MIPAQEIHDLKGALEKSFGQFIEVLSSVPGEQLNLAPFDGSWTPAQVATHIILATDGVPDAVTGPTSRAHDAFLVKIRPWWEDYKQKFSSPEVLFPDDTPRDKQFLLNELRRVCEKDIRIAAAQDLSATCLDMELPTIGYLTRYEWLHFIEMHVRRHLHQLKNIKKRLAGERTT